MYSCNIKVQCVKYGVNYWKYLGKYKLNILLAKTPVAHCHASEREREEISAATENLITRRNGFTYCTFYMEPIDFSNGHFLDPYSHKADIFSITNSWALLGWKHNLTGELTSLTCHYLLPLGCHVSKATALETTVCTIAVKVQWINQTETSCSFISSAEKKDSMCLRMRCEICFLWHMMTCSSSHNCIILLNPGLDHWC